MTWKQESPLKKLKNSLNVEVAKPGKSDYGSFVKSAFSGELWHQPRMLKTVRPPEITYAFKCYFDLFKCIEWQLWLFCFQFFIDLKSRQSAKIQEQLHDGKFHTIYQRIEHILTLIGLLSLYRKCISKSTIWWKPTDGSEERETVVFFFAIKSFDQH